MDSSRKLAHSFEGELIGTYLLHRQIGRGGMASVFLAERVSHSRAQPAWVAVKVMHPHLLSERKAQERFIEEIGMTALLKHPHICSVLDLGEHEGIPYLVMPLLKGRSIAELLEVSEPPPPVVVASIWLDLARGLSYAHNLKGHEGEPLAMIHRDISPHNAFVEYAGQAKLLDFGIAKLTPPGRREETSPLMGKIAYMSPEQLEEEAIDQRIDIWSLAVTAWEMCAHQPLFDARQPMRLMYQVLSDELHGPSRHRALPAVFDQVTLAGLERVVDQRPQDVLLWTRPIEAWLRAELSCPEVPTAEEEQAFDRQRYGIVADWMERHFDLSRDILSAQLTSEERDERIAQAQRTLSTPLLTRATPFSPLQGGTSSLHGVTGEQPMRSTERPIGASSDEAHADHAPTTPLTPVRERPYYEPSEPRPQATSPLLKRGALLTLLITVSALFAYLLTGGAFLAPSAPVKTLTLTVGKERRGGVTLDSAPCRAKVYQMPERKLLGRTPLSHTFKVGVYRLRFEPSTRKKRCVSRERLVEVDEGKILSYEVNLERAPR